MTNPYDDPIGRVLLGAMWLSFAVFVPLAIGNGEFPPFGTFITYYAIGLAAIPVAVILSYVFGSVAVSVMKRLGVSD